MKIQLRHPSRFVLAMFIIATIITQGQALSNYRFQHINRDLFHQQVEKLIQDDKGNLWIGTRNGLAKYDGYDIVTYLNEEGNPYSIPHNIIKYIFQDSKKRIWISTRNGICQYHPESDDFQRYAPAIDMANSIVETTDGRIICSGNGIFVYNEQKDLFVEIPQNEPEYIISMAVDNQNRLFCSTNSSIFYFDSTFSKKTHLNSSYFSDFVTGYDGIVPLYFDSKGYLWIGRNGKGITSINLASGESTTYQPDQLSDGTVRAITEDDQHKIWLGTEKGITVIHPDGEIEIIRQDFVNKNKLNDNAIYTIICDRDGNIWIGTYFGGINVLLRKTQQFNLIEPGYNSDNLKGKAIRNIIEPSEGTLYIATEDGGLNIYNTHTNDIRTFDKIPSLGHNIHDILYDRQNNVMWIGTFRNGLFLYNFNSGNYHQYLPNNTPGLPSDAIFCIKKQKCGKLWIATTSGLRYYDEEMDQFSPIGNPILDKDFIYCLLIDMDDNIWAGTRNNGLFRIDAQTKEIINWSALQLKDEYITCLYEDANNHIWVGTNNYGLFHINPKELEPIAINLDQTLSQSTICSIIEDNTRQLWIGTSRGLCLLDSSRNEIIRYTTEDGLPTNQFNFSSAIQIKNGTFYFGSINGLIFFNSFQLKDKKQIFEVHLKSLVINDQTVSSRSADSPLKDELDKTRSITLSNSQSASFYIEYGAISLGNAMSIKYQIKLKGQDNAWRDVGDERKFIGSNLAHGKYILQIRANNSNTGWENMPVKELEIVIKPPFYLSGYAFAIYLIIIIAGTVLILHVANERIKKKNQEKLALMEKEKSEELNNAKFEFFASVSHELKTPLSLIIAPLNYIVKNNNLQEDAKEKLGTVIKNANKMTELIDELVTFNKVETGNFRFYIQQGNPLDFIENITTLFKPIAQSRQIFLYTHCENNGEIVWFSTSFVEKILNNLLSNALKFSSEGGKIFVNAYLTDGEDGYTYLNISVQDMGIGIAKEEQENIFKKYYQTKRGYNKNNKGWGLGLSLVKQLSTIHKGNVSVESTIGQGSTFSVSLNVSENAFDAQNKITADKTVVTFNQYNFTPPFLIDSNQSKTVPAKSDTQFSILVVEDDEELLHFLSTLFTSRYNVYTATDGQSALEIARKNPIDLVISDIMMPVMDGIELCKKLKNDIFTSHIPVILLTAKNDTTDILEGYKSGADIYVQKPFDYQILEMQINNILKERKKLQEKLSQSDSNIEESSLNKFDKEFIDKINELIDKNIENIDFSIADITQTLAVSRSLLHIKMKNLLNISAGDYIRKRKMNKACSLLREGYNVSETAFKTGFSDSNYFSKVFKKELGMNPSEYINNCKRQNQVKSQQEDS